MAEQFPTYKCPGPPVCTSQDPHDAHLGTARRSLGNYTAQELLTEVLRRGQCADPHLGLASTKTLLEELHARAEVSASAVFEPYRPAYEGLRSATDVLLKSLPTNVLEYRTVDSE